MARYIDVAELIVLKIENKKLKEINSKLLERIEYLEICLKASQNKSENENLGNRCIRDIFLTR